jgi:glycerol-3-phosphate acyltransferase PlsY
MISVDVIWAAAIGYLLGSIPFAFLTVKIFLGGLDIRTVGSKNVGGRNVVRAFQHKEKPKSIAYTAGIVVAILDILKGFFAMWIAVAISYTVGHSDAWVIAFAGPAAILGHNWCIWLWSHAGRGVASTLGSMIFFNPVFLPLWLVAFFGLSTICFYSAITYIVSFIVMGLIFLSWWWFLSPLGMFVDPNTMTNPSFGLVAMVTMFAITIVVITRQKANFEKIERGEASRMKLWKIFKGKAEEALK